MTTFKAFIIQCITNMHAGSGDTTYGVIDKLVQRDPVTNYPAIHASSLKGALREHFEKKDKWGKGSDMVTEIFGKETNSSGDSSTGNCKFLSADLIALPLRCTHKQFVLAFDATLAGMVNNKAVNLTGHQIFSTDVLDYHNKFFTKDANVNGVDIYAEDYLLDKITYSKPHIFSNAAFTAFNEGYAVLKNEAFQSVVAKLPVIARNNIEDGTSKNLWYEEVVPHQTLFITFIGSSKRYPEFESAITQDIIQVGGNATIGYGLCKFYAVN